VRRRTDAAGHAEKRLPLAKVAAAAQRQSMPTWRPAPLETRPEGERGLQLGACVVVNAGREQA